LGLDNRRSAPLPSLPPPLPPPSPQPPLGGVVGEGGLGELLRNYAWYLQILKPQLCFYIIPSLCINICFNSLVSALYEPLVYKISTSLLSPYRPVLHLCTVYMRGIAHFSFLFKFLTLYFPGFFVGKKRNFKLC
jgi:hypothetical protein